MSKLVSGSSHALREVADSWTGPDKDVQSVPNRTFEGRTNEYLRTLALRMLAATRDVCIMAFVAFAYAALTNDAPKVSKSPVASPFFPRNSIVKDYFRGELSQAISSARRSDIAFVMFYAPWDSSSQESRKEFEYAARHMQKLVTFTAVNCWQPEGECRNQYNKVYSWPVFIAYPTHGRGIQYNGPLSALHMVRFLYSVMEPLKRIIGLDLHYLRQQYDAVIVANVNAQPGSTDYGIIYSTALRFLEHDPFQEIGFAINTQHSTTRKISIYMWNSTMVYLEDVWKSDNIISWIVKTIWQVSVWASPNGSKSLQLSRYIQPGPTLILFTPRNPLYQSYDYYDLEDQLEKSKVSDCVHNVLLVLCTTKYGVIFRDNQLGLGKSSLNSLMLTVVQSLDRPWEHSYASELVIKTCGACPDISRSVWSNLKESLTPRDTENWYKVIEFAKKLILVLGPDKIENSIENLNVLQLAQATISLTAPSSAIKAIITEDFEELNVELREVALEYHYCKNLSISFGTYLLSLGIHNKRIENYKKSLEPCSTNVINNSNIKEWINLEKIPKIITVSNVNLWKNNSYCARPTNKQDYCVLKEDSFLENRFDESLLQEKEKLQEMYENVVKKHRSVQKQNVKNEYILESYKSVYRMSLLTGFNDPRSPKNLIKSHFQNKCRLRNIAEKFSPIYFSESTINNNIRPEHDISGFACKTNRSLSIIAMDTLKYHHFAESLNVDILNKWHGTAAVIVDEKMESHYVLNGKVNDKTLREFIYKFYENNLSRALLSTSKIFSHSHVYPTLKNDKEEFFVKQLVSENFLSYVMRKNKAVVVLYHSKQCAFCSGISYKFLTVAKLFSFVTNLRFARIDGELNSLPWEYTMESYPTILFFPDKIKSETRVFPKSTPIDTTNLINFILTNLTPTLKIHAMWSLCNQSKFEEENQKCVSSVRLETLSLIEKTLQEWRKANIEHKPFILNKLRTLRNLHLLLAHSTDVLSIQKLMKHLHTEKRGA